MAEYIVVRPWFGVKAGQRIEIKHLTKAFAANVRSVNSLHAEATVDETFNPQMVDPLALADDQDNGVVAPPVAFDWESVRQDLIAELDDAGIDYEDDAPAEDLAALLPVEVAEGIKMSAE